MDHEQQLQQYIAGQLQSGQTPDTIMQQLLGVGWPEDMVRQAFLAVQASMIPTAMQQALATPAGPQANGKRHGRIATGFQILQHSLALLNGHRYLLRYFAMTWLSVILINGAWVALFWFAFPDFLTDDKHFYPLLFVGYLLIYCIINFYAAALSRNILDIYKGERKPYKQYIGLARARFIPILIYSLIEATIGMLLRAVIERLGWIGDLISLIVGSALSLVTLFVLPIIMDTPSGAIPAIRKSWGMLKENWGEGITAKVGPGVVIWLLQVALIFVLFGLIIALPYTATIIIAIILYIVLSISLGVIGSFASSVTSVALYYYAVNRQVPPGFSAEMLDAVLVKGRRQLRKERLQKQG